MVRSHIVPKLIVKRFANPINMFDTQRERLYKNRSPRRTFYEGDAYDDDVEVRLCQELEDPFAKVIDKKIINKDKVVLTRNELMLVKRFLLIQSVRTRGPDEFYRILLDFKETVDNYIMMHGPSLDSSVANIPSITEKSDNKFDLYMQAMKMFFECAVAEEMVWHKDVTKESYYWAKTFQDSYLVFWDSDEKQDFVLTDNGMTTEFDLCSRIIAGGFFFSKSAYLLAQHTKYADDPWKRRYYADLFLKNQTMYENFNTFNLTANRCVAVVNPFFRLYSNKSIALFGLDGDMEIDTDMPDVWPTFIQKDAFKVPDNKRILGHIEALDRDEYIYTPFRLSFIETVYINTLALIVNPHMIGFKDVNGVIDSIYCTAVWNAENREDVFKDDMFDEDAYNKHFEENMYVNMMNREYGGTTITAYLDPLSFWDICKIESWRDIIENRYLLEHLLSQEEMVRTHDSYGVMGTPDERMDFLRNCLSELNLEKK